MSTPAAMPTGTTKLTFWGVRGSIPTVDRETWRYGGNTPCVELTAADGTRFILDCGTGLRALGNHWQARQAEQPRHEHRRIEAHVFVTHYHWDHIQGLPFFAPLYAAENRFHFYSFRSKALGANSLRQVFEAQMASPYFPVEMSAMPAARDFTEMAGGDRIEIGSTRIAAAWLNHPQGCLGYRIETPAGVIVYATDYEPGVPELDRGLLELARGANIVIADAQYSPEQLARYRKGWGHSSWLEAVGLARDAGAQNLVLYHHDPESSDRIVDGLLRDARAKFANTWAATEGMAVTLSARGVEVQMAETPALAPV
jgi:phosphoribosyl 1,2-cyclic phosphodiesterase